MERELARDRLDGMKSFFEPKSIAVAGVSKDPHKLGSIIFTNLIENTKTGLLKATVYALNPAHNRIGDQPCYPSIGALPEVPELLVVAVPESQTVPLVKTAAESGVKAAVMITGGYAEVGRADVEERIGRLASRHGMRVLGPNTIGLVDTWSGVDSLFLRPTKRLSTGEEIVSMLKPLKGEIAIITQSGHLGEVIAEELAANGVGIRALVGTGNQLDVSIEDVIQYFANDENTRVIAVYLEGIRDGRRFMKIAASVVKTKPVVVFKVGKTGVGARAALTHTASIVGDYEVYRAALKQSGVIEASTFRELVDHSISLLMLPRRAGNRVVIITNAGGVGAIAADEAARIGLRVEPPQPQTRRRFRAEFRAAPFVANASLSNPIDLTASVSSDEFVRVVELFVNLSEYDLALVLPTHHAPGMGPDIAERLSGVILKSGKPVACSVIGNSPLASEIHSEFMSRRIPSFPTPEQGVGALAVMAEYARSKAGARGPEPLKEGRAHRFGQKRGPLPQGDVRTLMRSYGLAEPESMTVRTSRDLAGLKRFHFPAACKLLSNRLLHKTDVGGVVVDVAGAAEAELVFRRFAKLAARRHLPFEGMLVQEMVKGVEIILGGVRDPTFGPVVMVGLGGTYTELLRGFSLAVAPITPREAQEMVGGGMVGQVLTGYRGGPRVSVKRFSKVVSDFSRIMAENPQIEQMEVNPLMASGGSVLAVDTRVLLSGRSPDQTTP